IKRQEFLPSQLDNSTYRCSVPTPITSRTPVGSRSRWSFPYIITAKPSFRSPLRQEVHRRLMSCSWVLLVFRLRKGHDASCGTGVGIPPVAYVPHDGFEVL